VYGRRLYAALHSTKVISASEVSSSRAFALSSPSPRVVEASIGGRCPLPPQLEGEIPMQQTGMSPAIAQDGERVMETGTLRNGRGQGSLWISFLRRLCRV
jgi:hypothetical protein